MPWHKQTPKRRKQGEETETPAEIRERIAREIAAGERCGKCWLKEPHECETRTVVDYAIARKAGPWDVPKDGDRGKA